MKYYQVSRQIDASPNIVWKILTDRQALVDGGLGIRKISGEIKPNGHIELLSEISPKRAFKLKTSVFEPDKQMVWSSGMPFGLFRGARRFTLSPEGDRTNFHMREEFTGILLPMIWNSMPDLQPSFEQFADGLVRLAEGK